MIGEDDFDIFYDPCDFGTQARLIGEVERSVCGLLLNQGKLSKLRRDASGKAGIRAQPVTLHFQLPSSEVPVDYQDYLLRVNGADYSITGVESVDSDRCEFILVPFKKRGQQHGSWLRGEN